MAYQPGVPTGTVPLNQDYLNLQENFTQINNQFLIDHVPLTSTSGIPPNGYHKAIHLVQQAAPVAVADVGEIWCTTANDGYSSDTLFFQKTGLNLNTQLSRNFQPTVAGGNGYTFIPGGLVYQYGSSSAVTNSSSTTITFPIKFTANVFSIQLTAVTNDNSTIRLSLLNSPTLTQFTTTQTSSSHFINLYWVAIGN